MKTTVTFCVLMLIMIVSCSKDQFTQDEFNMQNGSMKALRANVPIPMKADFCFTPDMTLPPVHIDGLPWDNPAYYLPGGGSLSGNATHMGLIKPNESQMIITGATFESGTSIITWNGTGKVTGANGDYYLYNTEVYQNPDNSFTGIVNMFDGTGKFEGMTGSVQMVGQGTCWEASGTMVYDR